MQQLNVRQFFFDQVIKDPLIVYNPLGQWLVNNSPRIFIFLHAEHDPVATIVDYIDGKNPFLQSPQFSEVEFP
jgi:hypothetical protein